ncbi:MAG: UDP-N-acetylmuramoyl-L-alanyl-D-glutamate--2,6-diaminopimelate ligase [Deltaproteobacteria bacterium]|nr:UDP-N-acetylmuramoyl-L-alanyl-D-glutamate--2,6-diaminopimelate ligase [Deltaproteobacteria bacterium]
MNLNPFLPHLKPLQVQGPLDQAFAQICYDSRKVKKGDLFVALRGLQVDGHVFISKALQQGASVIVCESLPAGFPSGPTFVQVQNTRQSLAILASHFYQYPSCKILSVGITGTNGKTSSSYLLESILELAGYSPAVFGTINYRHGQHFIEASHTTPESLELQKMLRDFVNEGAKSLVMEVSSHALLQHRVDEIDFDAALFTNLSPEHLDFHKNMEDYFAAKCLLFERLLNESKKEKKYGIFNLDDPYGKRLAEKKYSYVPCTFSLSKNSGAQLYPSQVSITLKGIVAEIESPQGKIRCDSALVGQYNLSNLLGVVATSLSLGIPKQAIEEGIRVFKKVPGRLEKIENTQGVTVVVDYAHTPDALTQVLESLKSLQGQEERLKRGKLLVLFGCGGDRDSLKRPLMGQAVAKLADFAWVTSDNPRTEDPKKIVDQILPGLKQEGWQENSNYCIELDRAAAIRSILQCSKSGDIILIAGKGHEDYQIIGKKKIHFDDREEVEKFFKIVPSPLEGEGQGEGTVK